MRLWMAAIPGLTPTQDCASTIVGSTATCSIMLGGNSDGNIASVPVTTHTSAFNQSTSGTFQIVPLTSGKSLYITHLDFLASGTVNLSFIYGTGTNCAVNNGTIAGSYPLTAGIGMAVGTGVGSPYTIPPSQEVCIVLDQPVIVGGSVSWSVF